LNYSRMLYILTVAICGNWKVVIIWSIYLFYTDSPIEYIAVLLFAVGVW
jgi:hypothetical protein